MRIIAGIAGGRKLKSIKGTGTRPTLDRVKEAVFNMLAPVIPDCRGLDLFAGFGGLGLEAVSRGAEHITFVEKNYKNVKVIKENIEICNFRDKAMVEVDNVFTFLNKCKKKFDLIFMDPPYGKGYVNKTLNLICQSGLLNNNGLIVAEHHENDIINQIPDLTIIRVKKYGDTLISLLQN